MLRMKIRDNSGAWRILTPYLSESDAVAWIVILVTRFPDIEIDFV